MSNEIDQKAFERSAQAFFQALKAEIERPAARPPGSPPYDLTEQAELSRSRVADLVEQLQTGEFDRVVMSRARALASDVGIDVVDLRAICRTA